ncbi:hypothetical protein [Frisingicoccus sp.]|uniref:hypothetical protein n=1 Tax=Frisingicoccus sp. TaxID=1918627 RepID=UPI002EC7F698|nr:hypothetical protein [Frisingicoccus sp.]
MKKIMRILGVLFISCFMLTSLAACKDDAVDTTSSETSPVTEKETVVETETEPETKPFFEESRAEVEVEVPSEVDTMRPILLALCKTMTGGTSYDGSDPEFFWESIYAAINGSTWVHPGIRLSDSGSGYFVPREVMAEYAEAMFTQNSSLKDIPESMGGIEFDVDEDGYVIYGSDGYMGVMDIIEVEETATGYEVTTAFNTKSGNVESHTFILTSGGQGVFPCGVKGVVE